MPRATNKRKEAEEGSSDETLPVRQNKTRRTRYVHFRASSSHAILRFTAQDPLCEPLKPPHYSCCRFEQERLIPTSSQRKHRQVRAHRSRSVKRRPLTSRCIHWQRNSRFLWRVSTTQVDSEDQVRTIPYRSWVPQYSKISVSRTLKGIWRGGVWQRRSGYDEKARWSCDKFGEKGSQGAARTWSRGSPEGPRIYQKRSRERPFQREDLHAINRESHAITRQTGTRSRGRWQAHGNCPRGGQGGSVGPGQIGEQVQSAGTPTETSRRTGGEAAAGASRYEGEGREGEVAGQEDSVGKGRWRQRGHQVGHDNEKAATWGHAFMRGCTHLLGKPSS